jgi:hypothetical protein
VVVALFVSLNLPTSSDQRSLIMRVVGRESQEDLHRVNIFSLYSGFNADLTKAYTG